MRSVLLLTLGLVLAALLPPAAAQVAPPLDAPPLDAPTPDSAVVARVDGRTITVERFERSYVQHLLRTGRNDTAPERYAHLDALIDTYLLAAEARRRGLDDGRAYRTAEDRAIKDAVGSRYYGTALLDTLPDLTDAELREAYLRGRDRVTVRHLLFPTRAEAEAAHARLEAGADFVALANEVFETPAFDSTAGLLGEAGYWELADAFAEAAFSLPVAGHSEPVRTRYGWHIVRVEDRSLDPLPTESEYQYRRSYVRSQARLRRMRLAGDRFVRTFMENLDVRVDDAAVRALAAVVDEIVSPPASASPDARVRSDEVRALGAELDPETSLATFTLDGTTYTFTAADYVAWLPELPGREVRDRTAASVGRALRNEALALAGLARGLAADPWVVDEVEHRTALLLADALRDRLGTDGSATPTEAELRTGYERLGYDRLRSARADYWRILFSDADAADAARRALATGDAAPTAYPGYARRTDADLLGDLDRALLAHVRRAPVGASVVVGAGEDRWYVLHVERRAEEHTPFEDVRAELAAAIGPHLPELRLRRTLREEARVEVDGALFARLLAEAGLE